MALLNPPELRPSVVLGVVRYLGSQRGQQDQRDRLLITLAPQTLGGANPQRDVKSNLAVAIELGLIEQSADRVKLAEGVLPAVKDGHHAMVRLLRSRVLSDEMNTAPWRSQKGARDLTNALSWFLTLSPGESPIQMDGGGPRTAQSLQAKDFGPRQGNEETSNWPIGNANRFGAFRRWACSLGFAWVSPNGELVPDPSAAIRDALPAIFGTRTELTAADFMANLGNCVPVVDQGRYREFVTKNWTRSVADSRETSASLTDALERLTNTGSILLDDRADAARVAKAGGATFSHIRRGPKL